MLRGMKAFSLTKRSFASTLRGVTKAFNPSKCHPQEKSSSTWFVLTSLRQYAMVAPSFSTTFLQNARRPPPGIPATVAGQLLKVDLILGSYTRESSTIPLLNLGLPASLPVAPHPEESLYHAQKAVFHTFRDEQKMPNKVISLAFAGIAFAPWLVLGGLVCHTFQIFPPSEWLTTLELFGCYSSPVCPFTSSPQERQHRS